MMISYKAVLIEFFILDDLVQQCNFLHNYGGWHHRFLSKICIIIVFSTLFQNFWYLKTDIPKIIWKEELQIEYVNAIAEHDSLWFIFLRWFFPKIKFFTNCSRVIDHWLFLPKAPKAEGGSSMKWRSKSNWANAMLELNFLFSCSQLNTM